MSEQQIEKRVNHPLAQCERNLKAMPSYDVFRGVPAVFVCECGRRFEFTESEADGAWWELSDA